MTPGQLNPVLTWHCSLCLSALLQCPTCAKCFLSRTELQLHEAFKHRGEKLFVCEECGHRASSRNGLQMHIKAKHRYESLLLAVWPCCHGKQHLHSWGQVLSS